MDGKLVLKIVYADTYKTVAFDADVTVAQAMVILKQARHASSEISHHPVLNQPHDFSPQYVSSVNRLLPSSGTRLFIFQVSHFDSLTPFDCQFLVTFPPVSEAASQRRAALAHHAQRPLSLCRRRRTTVLYSKLECGRK